MDHNFAGPCIHRIGLDHRIRPGLTFLGLQSSLRGIENKWLICHPSLVHVSVLWFFCMVPSVGPRCVTVVFPDHTPLL